MAVVIYEKKGKIAYITINRPDKMNAMNTEVRQGLADCWTRVRDDPDVWTAIITGAGDKAFSSGIDLAEVGQRPTQGETKPILFRHREGRLRGLYWHPDLWKPVIAAISGYCLAGGFELALTCDFRIAAEHATFGMPEVTRSIVPLDGSIQRLPQMIPVCLALELLLTGGRIDAQRALRLGLINRVVPLTDLMSAAEALANKINENPPLTVRAIKETIYRGMDLTLPQGLDLGMLLSSMLRGSEDSEEGRRAFIEKRKPIYKGK